MGGASLAMPPPSQSNTLRKPVSSKQAPTEFTVAVYTFSHEKGEPMPYRIKIPSKNVSLRHVKEFLPKKGAFRFYFKTEIDGDMCYEEKLKIQIWFLCGMAKSWFSVVYWTKEGNDMLCRLLYKSRVILSSEVL